MPIFVKDEFVGAVGACGCLLDDGEADSFMINKTTNIETDKIENLSRDLPRITSQKAESLAKFIQTEIDKILI